MVMSMYVYDFISIHMHVFAWYVYKCVCSHVCEYMSIHAISCVHIYVCLDVYMCIFQCMFIHVYVCICLYVSIRVYVCACILQVCELEHMCFYV